MLVVVSDLHFEEEASNHIPSAGVHPAIAFARNLPAKPYQLFIAQLASEARRNGAKRLDLALAGDIFDVHRTGLWFRDNPAEVRPYVSADAVDAKLEAMLLRILDGIAATPAISGVLELFERLSHGRYLDLDGEEKPFPVPVQLHYLPGNHDRIVNATPAVRNSVRRLLGLPPSDDPFPHVLSFAAEQALVRHGHEYDRYNFSADAGALDEIPTFFPDAVYHEAAFGDFITVDVASRLPTMFREQHGDARILADPVLRTLYLRLLEFDDLRPMSAMFNYFIYHNGRPVDKDAAWQAIEPVVLRWLDEMSSHPFLRMWIDRYDQKGRLDVFDAVQAVLALRPWRWTNKIPFSLAESIAKRALAGVKGDGAESYAARERSIRSGQHRFLVAGHSHHPQVALIAHDGGGERYYVDTGTWRNRVPATPDFRNFGRLKALTYVILYGPDEDRGLLAAQDDKIASFDFWSGVTQGWERSNERVQTIGGLKRP